MNEDQDKIESSQIGVYFSANDAVYDWAVAFLNSYRRFNPHLPLYLIPFNDQCDRLLEVQAEYNFKIYTDASFKRLEAIGEAFELGHSTGVGKYWFRRYASFWGPLDEFMYLDARQLVLANLKPYVTAPRTHEFDFMHYDCALDQVYEPGPFRREMLRQNRARGFLSGMWSSKRGLFTMDEFEDLAEDALQIRDQLNPRNTDQAFINYCCDMKPVRYGHFAEVMGGICQEGWARQSGYVYKSGREYRRWDHGGIDHKKRVVLLHWAGIKLGSAMPERRQFASNRYRRSSSLTMLCKRFRDAVVYPFLESWRRLRSHRHMNQSYHALIEKE